ncbi:MAG: RnfH family protein [Pseudomonadota bacterium]|nr:RnfH family protein [Pseudomonadota bacterium]
MPEPANIQVEVLFALPDQQWLRSVSLPAGSTLGQAIEASGIAEHFNTLIVTDQNVGVYSRPASLATVLGHGDRVEIYRPLTRDPKDTRRLRARQQKRV